MELISHKAFIFFGVFSGFFTLVYFLVPKDWAWFLKTLSEQRARKSGLLLLVAPILLIFSKFLSSIRSDFLKRYLEMLDRWLVTSTLNRVLDAEEFVALQVFLPLPLFPVMLLAAFRIESFAPLKSPFVFTLCLFGLFLLGIALSLLILNDKVTRRRKSIGRELPFTLDMLTSAVQAGLDFSGAIRRLVQKSSKDSPLKEELTVMLKETNLGKTRSEALRRLANRVGLKELNTVVASLVQADQLGTSLGVVLTQLSDDIRVKRFQKAEKLALEAPVKMLFPLVMFIFPSVFIILIGPLILQISQNIK